MSNKYFFLYKTTRTDIGEYYLGKHATDDLEDGYLGSGKRLQRIVMKYGKDVFVREILSFHSSLDELAEAEKQLITQETINDPHCLNLTEGGHGGWSRCKKKGIKLSEEHRRKMSESRKGKPGPATGTIRSEESKAKTSEKLKGRKPSAEAMENRRKAIERRRNDPVAYEAFKEAQRQRQKARWQDPEFREKTGKAVSEGYKRKCEEDPEHKVKRTETNKKNGRRKKLQEGVQTPES